MAGKMTLREAAKYTIDFYQREYAWQERQVRELVDDLTGKFLDFYDSGHSRHEVEQYGHYFLGSIVISHKRSQRFIVDGQQRLTTSCFLEEAPRLRHTIALASPCAVENAFFRFMRSDVSGARCRACQPDSTQDQGCVLQRASAPARVCFL